MGIAALCCLLGLALSASAQMMTAPTPLPAYLLQPLAQSGAKVISDAITRDKKNYEEAIQGFSSANSTCSSFVESKKKPCGECIQAKCKARVESVCKPEQWQVVLGSVVNLATKDIPDFFSKSVPTFITKEIGGPVIKVGEEIGNFFSNTIPGGFVDLGKGVLDIGKSIGNVGKDIGNKIAGFGKDIGNTVTDIGKGFVNEITKFGNNVGDGFKDIIGGLGKIFGKRELRVRRSEPGCSDFERDSKQACLYYMKQCSDCDIDLERDCSSLASANKAVRQATLDAAWLRKYKQPDFQINSVTYDATSFDPATQGFSRIEVNLIFFGRADKFFLDRATQPFNPVAAGPVIAEMALKRFKAAQ